jgi:hypothetical protein
LFIFFDLLVILTMPSPSIQDAKPYCPVGGNWYTCTSGTYFIGCCASDPCHDGCPSGNLRAASYNTTYDGTFADQQCSAGEFYRCAKTNPPFLGCCKSNPCVIGKCQQSDLASAFLSSNPVEAADFTATLSASSLTITPTGSATATTIPISSASNHSRLSIGATIGIGAGGFVVVLALAAVLVVLCQRRSRSRKEDGNRQDFGVHSSNERGFNGSTNTDSMRYLIAGM